MKKKKREKMAQTNSKEPLKGTEMAQDSQLFKKCIICGVKLIPPRKNGINSIKYIHQKLCGDIDCYRAYSRLGNPPKEKTIIKIINCKLCNRKIEVYSNYPNRKFCSKECGQNFQKERYKTMITPYAPIALRFEILKRDNFTCQYCGRNVKNHNVSLHIDHILPRKKGGTDKPENLITACQECNLGKADVLLEDRKLKKEGYRDGIKG